MLKVFKNTLLIFIFIYISFLKCSYKLSDEEKISHFFSKKEVSILVTDSGLGGVSVATEVVERMKLSGVFKKANVIFFNAQPHIESGYNLMETTEQKFAIFQNALEAMNYRFQPDIILIACNTLSVLYDYTQFSKSVTIPIFGIIETGVDLIYQHLQKDPDAIVIIFATRTTIKQNKHKKGLVARGINGDRIITQPCPHLAGRIERCAYSDTTKALVHKYVKQSMEKIPDSSTTIFVSYNCSHYPYVDKLFKQEFKSANIDVQKYLNPNPFMIDFLFDKTYLHRFLDTEVSVKIVSQAELPPGKLATIYELTSPYSLQTGEALFDYQYEPDFFEWRSIAGKNFKGENKQ